MIKHVLHLVFEEAFSSEQFAPWEIKTFLAEYCRHLISPLRIWNKFQLHLPVVEGVCPLRCLCSSALCCSTTATLHRHGFFFSCSILCCMNVMMEKNIFNFGVFFS